MTKSDKTELIRLLIELKNERLDEMITNDYRVKGLVNSEDWETIYEMDDGDCLIESVDNMVNSILQTIL